MLPRGFREDRLHFITEGEASVHYILHYSPAASWLKPDSTFAVLDAGEYFLSLSSSEERPIDKRVFLLVLGGATIDITLYEATKVTPSLSLREVCGSECLQAGSVFVDLQAYATPFPLSFLTLTYSTYSERMLRRKLANSRFGADEFIQEIMSQFERKTVRTPISPYYRPQANPLLETEIRRISLRFGDQIWSR